MPGTPHVQCRRVPDGSYILRRRGVRMNSDKTNIDGQELYEIVRRGVGADGPSIFRSKVLLQPAGGWSSRS